MIAYLEKHGVTVDVPDDFTDQEFKDLNDNFHPQPDEAEKQAQKFVPNFYESHIKPALSALGPLGLPFQAQDIPGANEAGKAAAGALNEVPPEATGIPAMELTKTPEGRAFAGGAISGLTFGASKPLFNAIDGQDVKNHPVFDTLGEMTGGLGSLLATGGALKVATSLPALAETAGKMGVESGLGAASRFFPPAIMTGATFGTKSFIDRTVKAFQEGGVDLNDFGHIVLGAGKDTAFGALLGGISGVSNAYTAITAAGGLGYISSKADGADNKEALLSGAIWAAFETVGSFGREARLRTEALRTLSDSIGDYVHASDPTMAPEQAKGVGKAFVDEQLAQRGGIEEVAKSQPATLEAIEEINQKVRQSKIERPEAEGAKPEQITNERPGPMNVTPTEPNNLPVEPFKPAATPTEAKIPFSLEPDVAALQRGEKIESKPGQTSPQPAEPSGPAPAGTSFSAPRDEVFPATRVSSNPSIAEHPDFIKLSDDATAIVNHYAEARGVPATNEFATSLMREMHDALHSIFEGKNEEERLAIEKKVEAQYPDLQNEFNTLKEKLYSDKTDTYFEKAVAGQYGGMRSQVAIEAEAKRYGIKLDTSPVKLDKEGIPKRKPNAVVSLAFTGDNEPFPITHKAILQEAKAENYPSSKGGGRQFGEAGDQTASLKNKLGGLDKIQKMQGPELVKLAKSISGDVPIVKKIMQSLGYFRPGKEDIALRADLFKDPKLWESVLAHEIGHLMDFQPDKTMARGNILGRIASLSEYRKTLLPESPNSKEQILTPKDRARFRAEAERISKGKKEEGPDKQFEPQAILDVWNSIEKDLDPDLLTYIKGLDVEGKKSLIKGAMAALKNGEKITVHDINKFNKDAGKNFKRVADIYRDLLKKEIKKRKLWENEVIHDEFKKLSQYWKPFAETADYNYTSYRFSSPELYADFVSVLLNAPGKAKDIAPNGYQSFFNYLENKPEVMKNLLELQSLIQADDSDLQKSRGEDILKMFGNAEQAFRANQLNLDASKKSMLDKMRVLFIDKNSILLDEREKLAKAGEITPETDMRNAIEKNQMMATFTKSFLDNFDRLVYRPAKDGGLLNEVKTVLFLDRVGDDRSELANPLGHTPETAKAFLDNMQKTDPDKFQEVNSLAQAARDWYRGITNMEGSEDFFTSLQKHVMEQSDKYAPFRVIDFMKDYMSSGMAQQIGTLKDIGDPLTSIAMKGTSVLMAIERNRLKKIIGEGLIRSGMIMRPARVSQEPGNFKIQEPEENHLGTMAWKENGKWVAYHTDKDISNLFNHSSMQTIGQASSVLNTILGNRVFRPMYVAFNTGFQTALAFSDFERTLLHNPDISVVQLMKNYVKALGPTYNRVKGNFDPLIQEMERNGALQFLTPNDLYSGKTDDDTELEHRLEKYVIKQKEGAQGLPIIKQMKQILGAIHFAGDYIITLPKVAGWKALEDMTPEQRAYQVRNFVGHPNFKNTGTATPISNALFLFSNMHKEGLRDMYATWNNPEARGSYWFRTFMMSILPKIIQGLGTAGILGVGVKKIYDKMSEYHKTNYVVIPMGVTQEGYGVGLTIPQTPEARLLGGLFWKMTAPIWRDWESGKAEGYKSKDVEGLLSMIGGNFFPGLSPAFSIGQAWGSYLTGGMPHDNYRGQNIITDQEKSAGGLSGFEPMARWTMNKSGLVNLDIRDNVREEPLYKTAISVAPIVQRLIRIENSGEYEMAREAGAEVKQEKDKENLARQRQTMNAIKSKTSEEDFTQKAEDSNEEKKLKLSYEKMEKKALDNPWVRAIIGAPSSDEKIAILGKAKEEMGEKEFGDFLDVLQDKKIISKKILEAVE